MNKYIQIVQIFLIFCAGLVLNQIGFFKNANWPVVIGATILSAIFTFFSLRATIRTINGKS